MLYYASDYQEGAHPEIIRRLTQTNLDKTPGYGTDEVCAAAGKKIKDECGCPEGEVYFISGGTQANATVIGYMLKPYQGVISAATGHIATHEAGAIEAGGHKVLTLDHDLGKISAAAIEDYCSCFYADGNYDHMVMPGMVYISQPTEYGTLYSLKELEDIKKVCEKYDMPLYMDGARLAYALACGENDADLKDIARLCDVFYIGGTKCGALFGEAVVFPRPKPGNRFFTFIKRQGALLAKGRMMGLQFDELFTDGLYLKGGENAIRFSVKLRECLADAGLPFAFETPTNQVFVVLDNEMYSSLAGEVETSFWERYDDAHTVVRFCTSWATTEEDIEILSKVLDKYK